MKWSLIYIALIIEPMSICLAQEKEVDELLKLGVRYVERGEIDSAIYYWNKVIEVDSNSVEGLFNIAMLNYGQKNYNQAIAYFSNVLMKSPNDKQALRYRAICKDSIGNNLGAKEDREIAAEIVELPNARIRVHTVIDEEYIRKGDEWIEKGDYEKGIQYYSEVIDLSPTKFLPYYKRAYAYLDIGEIDKAIPDLLKADSLQPNDGSILAELAYCYYYKQENKKGRNYSKKALKIDESHPLANYYAGVLELQVENYKKGLNFLLKAISLGFDSGRAYFNLAVAYYFLDDMENACKNWGISEKKGFQKATEAINENCI